MSSDGDSGDTDEFVDWVPTTSASSPPPSQTIEWVERELGARVTEVTELVGGLSSAVHRLQLDDANTVVLRRFTLSDWMAREPAIPHGEAEILSMLRTLDLGITTPTLLAADPDADHCDVPSIVMTEVPGRPWIDPVDPLPWAERQAECLARMHQQPVLQSLPRYRRWDEPNRPLPIWAEEPDTWRQALALANIDLPVHVDTFLHRDFHPNNLHWVDGELVAVVDWLSVCTGPIAVDLAHNRWNLAILTEPAVADHFTAHYRALTGYSEDVLLFDLSTVLSGPVGLFPTHAWNALGRTDLTSDVVAKRINSWLRYLLR